MLLACANTVRQPVFTRMCILAFLPCRCYGSDMMAREDVAVVCALVLLLRLGRFPEPDGFGELRPLLVCALMFGTRFKGGWWKQHYRLREAG